MRKSTIIFVLLGLLFLPFFIQAAEFQVKIIESEADLPENFCSIWEKETISSLMESF